MSFRFQSNRISLFLQRNSNVCAYLNTSPFVFSAGFASRLCRCFIAEAAAAIKAAHRRMKRVAFRVRVPASGLLQRQHIVFLLRQPCSRMLHLAPFPTSQEQDDALLAHFVQRSVPPSSLLHKEAEKVGMMRWKL